MQVEKDVVRAYWDAAPCGTTDVALVESARRFEELERIRYAREPFIERFALFDAARGKRLLEIGVGAGTDHVRFARAGADCVGVDLSAASVETTRQRLAAERLSSDLRVADAENLPFADASFDVVYSWGVIHHTPDTARSAREALRVLRDGGRFCVMVYNRHSLVALQAWAVYGALRGKPLRTLADVLAHHMESPGTKGYTQSEVRALFRGARSVHVETVVTAYDMRVGRRRFLPAWTWRAVPARLGWFHVATGEK
ncbi:MAG: class I SAM-dependent methyltransferase [Polyangiaceae bacterium]|jgi:ubiquinone/menaquinone biosynthesis C-methylase UbiE